MEQRPGERPRPSEPPPGSPWDDPIAEAPLVFVDLEMTGLAPATDRVLEVCLERVRGDHVEDALVSLVCPEGGAFGNAHIHGIDPAEVAVAPSFAELAPRVLGLLDGAILVAHAAAWDVAFLEAELARAAQSTMGALPPDAGGGRTTMGALPPDAGGGRTTMGALPPDARGGRTAMGAPPPDPEPRRIEHYLDTLTLSRRAFALPSHRLGALCEAFAIDRGHAHRAASDVAALRAVFGRVLGVLSPRTPRDLWHVRVGQRRARPDLVAVAIQALEHEAPVTVRYRPARRGPEELVFRITAVRTDLDPPRVLGYLLPSRSRRELRADRILAILPHPAPG